MKQQWTSQVWGAALLVAAAAGCSSSDGNGTSNNGTAAAGSTGSATAGSGTAATAGAAGAAAGGASTGPFACGAKSTKQPAELYSAVATAILPMDASGSLPCAFSSCHNAGKKAAKLALPFGGDLVTLLVSVPSCEVPAMNLVEPGGGDAALKKSWLYNKLAAPVDGSASLIPEADWGTPGQCGQMADFGMRMPISSGADGVGEAKLAVVKEWICAGAPGPS